MTVGIGESGPSAWTCFRASWMYRVYDFSPIQTALSNIQDHFRRHRRCRRCHRWERDEPSHSVAYSTGSVPPPGSNIVYKPGSNADNVSHDPASPPVYSLPAYKFCLAMRDGPHPIIDPGAPIPPLQTAWSRTHIPRPINLVPKDSPRPAIPACRAHLHSVRRFAADWYILDMRQVGLRPCLRLG